MIDEVIWGEAALFDYNYYREWFLNKYKWGVYMKEYQNAGMADKNSCIIFNGVRVPAGFYDKWEDSFKLYNSII